uniref:hypothetical protein n=1 Tax=Pedobacter sp. ASV28 TaxID=2795123 RepID=UPI001E52368D
RIPSGNKKLIRVCSAWFKGIVTVVNYKRNKLFHSPQLFRLIHFSMKFGIKEEDGEMAKQKRG